MGASGVKSGRAEARRNSLLRRAVTRRDLKEKVAAQEKELIAAAGAESQGRVFGPSGGDVV